MIHNNASKTDIYGQDNERMYQDGNCIILTSLCQMGEKTKDIRNVTALF